MAYVLDVWFLWAILVYYFVGIYSLPTVDQFVEVHEGVCQYLIWFDCFLEEWVLFWEVKLVGACCWVSIFDQNFCPARWFRIHQALVIHWLKFEVLTVFIFWVGLDLLDFDNVWWSFALLLGDRVELLLVIHLLYLFCIFDFFWFSL